MRPIRLPGKKSLKLKNVKTTVDNILFHSGAEARRYTQLSIMQRSGVIADLILQPVFNIEINEISICKVILDFKYRVVATGRIVWEDVKGKQTVVSSLKKKLVEAVHGIEVDLIRMERARRARRGKR